VSVWPIEAKLAGWVYSQQNGRELPCKQYLLSVIESSSFFFYSELFRPELNATYSGGVVAQRAPDLHPKGCEFA